VSEYWDKMAEVLSPEELANAKNLAAYTQTPEAIQSVKDLIARFRGLCKEYGRDVGVFETSYSILQQMMLTEPRTSAVMMVLLISELDFAMSVGELATGS
jgi:hypothetical protein